MLRRQLASGRPSLAATTPPSSRHNEPASQRQRRDAERSLERSDLTDELDAVRGSKDRRFWRSAKWFALSAIVLVMGFGAEVAGFLWPFVALAVIVMAIPVFLGQNAREDEILAELEETQPHSPEAGNDAT